MPNIILTDEELQEVDRLLAEFDPENYEDTRQLLAGLSDEDRQVLCTLVRETQRIGLEIALGMRGVVEKVESVGAKARTLELHPLASMEDGWMDLLTCLDEIHPLYPKAIEIMASISETAWDPFSWACVAPADRFSRLEDIYAQSAPA